MISRKTWLIIKREYQSRVMKKSFLITTFLMPLLFVGLIAGVTFITVKSKNPEKVAIADKTNELKEFVKDFGSVKYEFINTPDTSLLAKGYNAILVSPQYGINTTNVYQIYSRKSENIDVISNLERQISKANQTLAIMKSGNLSKAQLDSLSNGKTDVEINNTILNEKEKGKQSNFGVASIIGYLCGFLIYITLLVYGSMVMRGVSEEKTNRIAEVMISSVKPQQLMTAKVIGIGAVGITQFLLWVILIIGLNFIASMFIPAEVLKQVADAQQGLNTGNAPNVSGGVMALAKTQNLLGSVNIPLVVGCFLFYFTFGYLFYASLFAAVGSLVNEDPQEAQALVMPIMMPLIFAIIIVMNAMRQPESGLATWASIIPFFSPVVMMARIPFGVPGTVPWWQLGLSMALLVLGFMFTTWLSARIYRTAILMYGKKITLKELWKWARK
jgi:ABC-2 type transport system permease protein